MTKDTDKSGSSIPLTHIKKKSTYSTHAARTHGPPYLAKFQKLDHTQCWDAASRLGGLHDMQNITSCRTRRAKPGAYHCMV